MYKRTPSRITIRNRRRFVVRAILWSGFAAYVFSIVRPFWIGEAKMLEGGGMVSPNYSIDLPFIIPLSIVIILVFYLFLSFVSRLKIRMVTVVHSRTRFYESWSRVQRPYYFVTPSNTVDVRIFGKRWLRTFHCSPELRATMKDGKSYVVCIDGTSIEAARLATSADEWKLEQGIALEMGQ